MSVPELSLLTGPRVEHPLSGHALDCFEAWAQAEPSLTAVRCRGRSLTYGELDSIASSLARRLVEDHGVSCGDRIVVCMDRSVEILVGIVAVLKAGAVYVPLEPSYPTARLEYLLSDSDPVALLIDEHTLETRRVVSRDLPTIVVNADAFARDEPGWTIKDRPGGEADFYLIYTSGTTGAPKGARVCHRNIVNMQHSWIDLYELAPGDRCYQTTTLGFDVFTADWTRTLASGAALHLSSRNYTLDPQTDISELVNELVDGQITFAEMNTTTTRRTFRHLVETGEQIPHLRTWVVGADAWYLDEHVALESHFDHDIAHFNTYGVSECAVDSVYFHRSMLSDPRSEPGATSAIGRPLPNTQIAVIGPDDRVVPVGVVGELCILGAGVGHGYLNRPELTGTRFASLPEHADVPCYRTGDLVFVSPDGVLEFEGRADDQVEIGSKRVELAEVQHAARGTGLVGECVAFGRKLQSRETQLWLGAVPATADVTEAQVELALSAVLPVFMRPRVYLIDALPLTPNGKVDRSALSEDAAASRPG